jgi:hypothetical protein
MRAKHRAHLLTLRCHLGFESCLFLARQSRGHIRRHHPFHHPCGQQFDRRLREVLAVDGLEDFDGRGALFGARIRLREELPDGDKSNQHREHNSRFHGRDLSPEGYHARLQHLPAPPARCS